MIEVLQTHTHIDIGFYIHHKFLVLYVISYYPTGSRQVESMLTSDTSMPPQSPPTGQNSSATNGGSTSSDGGEGDLGSDAEGRKDKREVTTHTQSLFKL